VGSPLEAVDPATIAPGEPGSKTTRSRATATDTGTVGQAALNRFERRRHGANSQ
jgi:hypothetical protein